MLTATSFLYFEHWDKMHDWAESGQKQRGERGTILVLPEEMLSTSVTDLTKPMQWLKSVVLNIPASFNRITPISPLCCQ